MYGFARIDRWLTTPTAWGYDDADRVADGMACPNPACGESRVDWLRIADFDENAVHCETCGTWYKIPEPEVG